ncbi:hypothetical protein IV417_12535 [Alphaproteobacteria bacterium KMM 3653]|uniref:Uncharacterized protein n=1 Tax=Harenicola maris TaxID=2841044 RepID=A0AAP2CS36_9RHOB|nr:hypothetical protein [Harenicola maris]
MTKLHLITALTALCASAAQAQDPSITTGAAETTIPTLYECAGGRPTAVGEITAQDGTLWTVPAETQFTEAPKAADLYNECNDVRPSGTAEVDLSAIPVIDAGGSEEFTAYLFGDNYFELYANGQLLAVDAVPFTPFNSSVVRFTAQRPVTLAVKMVDWEENLGLGSEKGRGVSYSPGDGGLTMLVTDQDGEAVLLSDETWRAQTFYTGPLTEAECLSTDGPLRDSSACEIPRSNDGSSYKAAHWEVPADWFTPEFDDSAWPQATTYDNDTVGVDNKPSFTNFPDLFDREGADAQFIWSSNLVLDNLVLLRRTID